MLFNFCKKTFLVHFARISAHMCSPLLKKLVRFSYDIGDFIRPFTNGRTDIGNWTDDLTVLYDSTVNTNLFISRRTRGKCLKKKINSWSSFFFFFCVRFKFSFRLRFFLQLQLYSTSRLDVSFLPSKATSFVTWTQTKKIHFVPARMLSSFNQILSCFILKVSRTNFTWSSVYVFNQIPNSVLKYEWVKVISQNSMLQQESSRGLRTSWNSSHFRLLRNVMTQAICSCRFRYGRQERNDIKWSSPK